MNNQRQLLLGVFFIVALSILAYYTLFLTESHLFSEPHLMTVYFPEANNLREGDPVQLLGARIGRVKEVVANVTTSDRAMRIRTVLSLESEIELTEDAEISIQETSLLGGRNVLIDPGTHGGPPKLALEDGGYLGIVKKNPIESFGDIGAEFSRLLKENRERISGFFENMDVITDDVRAGNGLFGRLIQDKGLADDARAFIADARTTAANFSEASAQFKAGPGLVPALLYDEVPKQKFNEALDSMRQLAADLKSGEGLLSALIYDPTLKERLARGLDSMVAFGEKLNASEGTLPMLLTDTGFKDQLKTALNDFSATMADVRAMTADVRAGKGSLGKFLTDDSLYDGAKQAVGVLTRSLEDYREAAPITAFTSVLFAAF